MKTKKESCCDENRRNFMRQTASLLTLAAAGGGSVLLQSCEKDWDKLTDAQKTPVSFNITQPVDYTKINPKSKFPFINLKNIGCGIIKRFENVNYGIPVMIIKIGEHTEQIDGNDTLVPDFVVFSSMCTHNNCLGNENIAISKIMPSRGKEGENREIVCSCHGSRYDAFNNAKVIQGPAEKPLRKFDCSYDYKTTTLTIQFY